MFHSSTVLLFFLASAGTWFAALRAYASLPFTRRRNIVIAISSVVAGVALIAAAVLEIVQSGSNKFEVLRLLTGVNLAGAGVTFSLAARKGNRNETAGVSPS